MRRPDLQALLRSRSDAGLNMGRRVLGVRSTIRWHVEGPGTVAALWSEGSILKVFRGGFHRTCRWE